MYAIRPLLEGLGQSSGQIADSLRAQNISGLRHSTMFLNPVVRFVRDHIPAGRIDLIAGSSLRIEFPSHGLEYLTLPEPVRQFVHDFDQGRYPELENKQLGPN